MRDALRLVWVYDREHLQHPFILLGLKSLAQSGVRATMVSSDVAPANAPYDAMDAFSFASRTANWEAARRRAKPLEWRLQAAQAETRRLREAQAAAPSFLQRAICAMAASAMAGLCVFQSGQVAWGKAVAAMRRDTFDTWLPYLRGFRRLLRIEADVIMASRPEAAMWAALAAKLRGLPFVYFPFELYGDQLAKPHPVIMLAERLVLRFAVDGLVTQNDMRARVYAEERHARVTPVIVHNFKPASWSVETPRLRAENPRLAGKRIVLYEGQLVGGRWLDRLANSVPHLPDDVVLVMMGPEKAKWLKHSQAALAPAMATGRLIILPPARHDDLPQLVADADLGVIIYDDSVRNNVFCEPGKLVDYIAVGVPVIAPNFPTIAPLVSRYDIGVCFESATPEGIAEAILRGLARPKANWAPSLQRACTDLTWETQYPVLLAAIEQAGGVRQAAAAPVVEREPVSA